MTLSIVGARDIASNLLHVGMQEHFSVCCILQLHQSKCILYMEPVNVQIKISISYEAEVQSVEEIKK